MQNLLQVPPQKRMTAQQALQHEYFQVKNFEKNTNINENFDNSIH